MRKRSRSDRDDGSRRCSPEPAWPGVTPEQAAIDNENTPDNSRRRTVDEARAAAEEHYRPRVRELMIAELASLSHEEHGCLAAYWNDVLHYSYEVIAGHLGRTAKSTCTAKSRALGLYKCGDVRGRCDLRQGCAHRRGQDVWEDVMHRVVCFVTSEVV